MKIKMILALGPEYMIGHNGKLPWHSKEELNHFKIQTVNKPVIFGKNTFFNLPKYPLKNRLNIVLSHYIPADYVIKDGYIQTVSLEKALEACKAYDECFICGGLNLYLQAFEKNICDEIILTLIESKKLREDYFKNSDEYVTFNEITDLLAKNYKFESEIIYEKCSSLKEENDLDIHYYEYIRK
jgi:dihydrofolate reductase